MQLFAADRRRLFRDPRPAAARAARILCASGGDGGAMRRPMRITGRTRLAGIMGWPVVAFALAGAARFLARRERHRRRLRAAAGQPGAARSGAAGVAGARLSRLQSDDPAQADGAGDRRPGRAAGAPHRRGEHDHRRCRRQPEARNTDAFGFRENLRESAPDWDPAAGRRWCSAPAARRARSSRR